MLSPVNDFEASQRAILLNKDMLKETTAGMLAVQTSSPQLEESMNSTMGNPPAACKEFGKEDEIYLSDPECKNPNQGLSGPAGMWVPPVQDDLNALKSCRSYSSKRDTIKPYGSDNSSDYRFKLIKKQDKKATATGARGIASLHSSQKHSL